MATHSSVLAWRIPGTREPGGLPSMGSHSQTRLKRLSSSSSSSSPTLGLCIRGTMGFPGGSAGKESACNVGNLGSIPGMGRSPGEGKSYPLQYSGLENSMDCLVHGVAKSQT